MVKVLTDQGIVMDISHLSDQGVEDLFQLTDRPVMASHSDIRRSVGCAEKPSESTSERADLQKRNHRNEFLRTVRW